MPKPSIPMHGSDDTTSFSLDTLTTESLTKKRKLSEDISSTERGVINANFLDPKMVKESLVHSTDTPTRYYSYKRELDIILKQECDDLIYLTVRWNTSSYLVPLISLSWLFSVGRGQTLVHDYFPEVRIHDGKLPILTHDFPAL